MTSSKPTKVGSFQRQEKKKMAHTNLKQDIERLKESAGHVSQEAVKRYILEQEGKDVFEYSVFGSPNQKIGQFASQTKLGEWS